MKDKHELEPGRRYGFYGGNFVHYDGKGFSIKMGYGESIYLERNEASSLASILSKLLFNKKP